MTPRKELLVSPAWLDERLDLLNLRVFDCRLTRVLQAEGPSLWKSEKDAWEQGHVPGSSYLHLIDDLCDRQASLPFMLPAAGDVSALLSRFGVSEKSTVVLYGFAGEWVTHRIWWSLKAFGLADVRVLDGGFLHWQSEGLPWKGHRLLLNRRRSGASAKTGSSPPGQTRSNR